VKLTCTLHLVVLIGGLPPALAAQGWDPRITASVSNLTTVTMDSSSRRVADGFSVGVDGAVRRGRLTLLAGYAEGPIGTRAARMVLAEGWAGAQLQLVPALAIRAGPVVRVLVADSLTLRWVHWRVVGRVTAPLTPTELFAYGEGWAGAGARSGIPEARSSGVGGTVGVGWRIGRGSLRVEYAVDEARRPATDRLTVERLALILDLEWR
jgi:hypothetical protein